MSINAVLANQQSWHIQQGDVLDVLRQIPDGVVQCVVTSPPYWGLRDYGTAEWEGGNPNCDHRQEAIRIRRNLAEAANACDGGNRKAENRNDKDALGLPYRNVCAKCGARRIDQQIGLEDTPEKYVARLVEVFREVRRVLRKDGTVWCNLGDSYAGSGRGLMGDGTPSDRGDAKQGTNRGTTVGTFGKIDSGLKPKDLIGIPWRVAFALQADGWWLRSAIPWVKGSAMPESVTDRPTTAHEYIFLLTKSKRYFYDAEAVREPSTGQTGSAANFARNTKDHVIPGQSHTQHREDREPTEDIGSRNRRTSDWWRESLDGYIAHLQHVRDNGGLLLDIDGEPIGLMVNPQPFKDAHFATFPVTLVDPLIKAGSSERGQCPNCGAPWERIIRKGLTAHDGETESAYDKGTTANRLARLRQAARERGGEYVNKTQTLGWRPTCTCNAGGANYAPDDLEVIETPTGERAGEDPTLYTGRAGFNRPRGDSEGKRPITRYEQRMYAEQLRESPHRDAMAKESGTAFDHYTRTDKSGARPVPSDLLETWIARGWIERVNPPKVAPYEPVPCLVLDPFAGAGTTLMVALRLGRRALGIELNGEYVAMAERRIAGDCPLFNMVMEGAAR
jgi:DNA modification methylase